MARKRLLLQAGALTGTLALALTGCGGGSESSSSTASGSSSSGNAAPSGDIRNPSTTKGGELKLAATSDFDSLDPARTYYGYGFEFNQRFLTRTLVQFQAKPGQAGTELAPDLATEVPMGTENNTVWTYKLKPGLKFEDGSPITSKDIKYGVERVFASDQITGGPDYVKCLLTVCDKDGASPYQGPYKDKAGLDAISTPDDMTISFKLVKPFADWNYIMNLPGTGPVPEAQDKGANYQSKPVSSGPYKIVTYTPGKSLMLDRNPNYDQSTDPVRLALPDTVNVQIGAQPADIDQQILDNQVDYAIEDVGVQSATQARLLNRDGSIQDAFKNRVSTQNTGYLRYLTLQTNVPPLDNVHCRRAVQFAVNKVDLQNARGGPITGDDIADNSFPPSLAGAPQNAAARYPNGADHKGDIEAAKRELAECGQPNGFKTVQASSNTPKSKAVAAATQQALERVGITVEVKSFDAAQYYASVIGSPSNVKAKGFGIADAGWGPDFPTGYGFYSQIVDGRKIKPAGNSNYSSLDDPKINQLIDESLEASSREAFNMKYQELDKQLMENATMVPFVFDRSLAAVSERLKNVYFNQGYGHFDLATMGVQ